MNNNLILEELFRMREIMGISLSETIKNKINSVLLLEAGKAADEIFPIGAKSVDNLTKQGVDFANDLSKLSDEFTNQGIKTFDDLTAVVASKNPTIDPKNITDDMIKAYIKNDDKLYKSILAKAASAAAAEADILVKNADVTAIFRADPAQLVNAQRLLGASPSIRTIDTLIQGVDDSIVSIEKTIDDVNMGNVPGVTTVPKDLDELYEQLLAKKLDLENYKNKDVAPEPVKFPDPLPPISDEAAEKVMQNSESTIDEVFNVLVGNAKMKKLYAPGLSDEQIELTRTFIKAKYGNIPLDQLLKNLDQVRGDMINDLQRQVNDIPTGAKGTPENPELKRKAGAVLEFLYDNKITRACLGSNKAVVNPTLKLSIYTPLTGFLCYYSAAVSYKMFEWVNTPAVEQDPFFCPLLAPLGACRFMTGKGWCVKSCGEGEDTEWFPNVYENKFDPDFKKWVTDNGFTNPDLNIDDAGVETFLYNDKENNRQEATYDGGKKTFN
jgi:hypothetical protein